MEGWGVEWIKGGLQLLTYYKAGSSFNDVICFSPTGPLAAMKQQLEEEKDRRMRAEEESATAKHDLKMVNIDMRETHKELERIETELKKKESEVSP